MNIELKSNNKEDEILSNLELNIIDNMEFDEEDIDDDILTRFKNGIIRTINKYVNIQYLNIIFTVILGTTLMVLAVVLCSDLKPEMIPFNIVPIQITNIPCLARQISILCTFLSFITSDVLFMRIVLVLSFGVSTVDFKLIKT